jgi:hypothetical protein
MKVATIGRNEQLRSTDIAQLGLVSWGTHPTAGYWFHA